MSIKYTNKFQIRKKLSFQITVVLILFVVSSVLYTPWLIFSDIFTKSNNLTLCDIKVFVTNITMDTASLLAVNLIPFIVMTAFSCVTGYSLLNNKRRLYVKKLKREKRFFKVLLSENIFFFFCCSPWLCYDIANDLGILNNISHYYISVIKDVTFFIYNSYCSCSIIVHIISNKRFRLYLLTCFKVKREEANQMVFSNTLPIRRLK